MFSSTWCFNNLLVCSGCRWKLRLSWKSVWRGSNRRMRTTKPGWTNMQPSRSTCVCEEWVCFFSVCGLLKLCVAPCRQLSSEQAVLQQSLQKESKVNKRLSMENEELLWKLQNCDLLPSPCRLSPTSPFSSPRNSATFPAAAPLSPR